MSFLEIIYTILIMPLQLFFEIFFSLAQEIFDDPGKSIVALSLVVNFLVLPLYRRADAMQEEERDMQAKLRDGVAHIKKTFKGDERMMILSTYYRQNNYKPTYIFRGSISLFLEIPFFIAAYHFLSHLELLVGVPFWFIRDLGRADGLLLIAGHSVNILPFVMTGVNLISCLIFTKGFPAKTKIQLYGMALFFMVFLYGSPAGLVLYWTLNNIFSLVKTCFYKMKNPKKVLVYMATLAGLFLIVYGLFIYDPDNIKKQAAVALVGIILMIPVVMMATRKLIPVKVKHAIKKHAEFKPNRNSFTAGAIYLTALMGGLIPSSVIVASPQEFASVFEFVNPLWYVASALCYAIGYFLVWFGVFYWLAPPRFKVVFERGIWVIAGVATIDYMFFGKNLGLITNTLRFQHGLSFSDTDQMFNLIIVAAAIVVLIAIAHLLKKYLPQILMVAAVAVIGMTLFNSVKINASVSNLKNRDVEVSSNEMPSFTLSTTGNNVIVFMLDRGVNAYAPYIFAEKPELKDTFSGFTCYTNTLSYGASTNFGSPALYGGYEYTPTEMNKRDTENLVNKHNEALKVMPVLFSKAGFKVTVFDPTYANYQAVPDTSIYNDYPDIDAYITNGIFVNADSREVLVKNNKRNFFCYSVVKCIPLCVQDVFYNKGNYNQATTLQTVKSVTEATGINPDFMNAYSVLDNMSSMTKITDDKINTFFMMSNDTAHEPAMLQEPAYEPSDRVDNSEYEASEINRFDSNYVSGNVDSYAVPLNIFNEEQVMSYQANMAAMLKIGQWIDYLKEAGVYDNTRIIIVADHGANISQIPSMVLADETGAYELERFYPLLMVKDFNDSDFKSSEDGASDLSHTISFSDEFMTNADVPTLATMSLVDNPKNPFTGKAINNSEKLAHSQLVIESNEWNVDKNNGKKFLPSTWLSVERDVRNPENWKVVK